MCQLFSKEIKIESAFHFLFPCFFVTRNYAWENKKGSTHTWSHSTQRIRYKCIENELVIHLVIYR